MRWLVDTLTDSSVKHPARPWRDDLSLGIFLLRQSEFDLGMNERNGHASGLKFKQAKTYAHKQPGNYNSNSNITLV